MEDRNPIFWFKSWKELIGFTAWGCFFLLILFPTALGVLGVYHPDSLPGVIGNAFGRSFGNLFVEMREPGATYLENQHKDGKVKKREALKPGSLGE